MRCRVSLARVVLVLALLTSLSAQESSETPEGSLSWTFRSTEYRVVPGPDGTRVEMEGCGSLGIPGAPCLPSKTITLALPPGARATMVSVEAVDSTVLPGVFRIAPAPSPILLVDPSQQRHERERMRQEWARNQHAAYSTDRAYPESICELTGTGSLRKYAYAKIAIRPFTYHPLSGRLVHHDAVRIAVHYRLPQPGSAEARHQEVLLARDHAANERAARLFDNASTLPAFYPASWLNRISPFRRGSDYLIIPDEVG